MVCNRQFLLNVIIKKRGNYYENLTKNNKALPCLEVVLAIVIIAIASFGVYKLYDSSSTNSKLSSEENVISQIYNEATQLASLNSKQPSQSDLVNSGAFPSDMYKTDTSGETNTSIFIGAFGDITYDAADDGSYSSIEAVTVPGSVVNELISHMKDWGDVEVSGGNGSTTSYESGELYTVTLYFPKGAK